MEAGGCDGRLLCTDRSKRVNLRDLKYLVAVADTRHFGRAAEACFVSQPTLSTQVRKLEEFLGVTLIERNNRQVLLTPIGEKVVEQARKVLSNSEQLVKLAREARDPLGGEFRLGIIPTVAPYLLPDILPSIREAYPDLQIQLVESQTAVITESLRRGQLDALILALPVEDDNIRSCTLYLEPFYLAAAPDNPICKLNSVRSRDLEHMEVLLLEDGHCLREQALEVCKQREAIENTNFSATSIETLRHMVAANIGITLMPELARDPDERLVRYLPFEPGPHQPHREIGLAWRNTSTREQLLEGLAEIIRQSVRTSMPLPEDSTGAGAS